MLANEHVKIVFGNTENGARIKRRTEKIANNLYNVVFGIVKMETFINKNDSWER